MSERGMHLNRRKFQEGIARVRVMQVAGVVAAVALASYLLLSGGPEEIATGTTFIAQRGNLDVTVVEGGAVEALESQEIRSQIKGHQGIKILSIVEEGYLVTPEDVEDAIVLVELDSADLKDKMMNQEIAYQSAEAQYIEKQAQYDIQVNQNQSNIAAAELNAKFALMDFEKFLGKKAVNLIVVNLGLDRRAAELAELKRSGAALAVTPLEPPRPASGETTQGPSEASQWRAGPGEFEGGRSGEAGGARGQGRRGEGAGGRGGGMSPERFRQLIESNGGKIPEAMADRMREMGMDPDAVLERMGIASGGDVPKVALEVRVIPEDVPKRASFATDAAYLKARAAINFSSYADAALLEDGEGKQQLRQLQDKLLVAQEDLRLAKTRLEGQERLAARNFITQNDLDLERVKVQKADIKVESAITENNLYIEYSFPKEAEWLLSEYEEALMNLDRTMQEARAKLSQAEAGLKSAKHKYNVEYTQLLDLRDQIEKCVIRAERSGLVVYGSSTGSNPWRRSNEEPIQEGTTLRQRQLILIIPDMTQMGVKVNIHESAVQKVAKGQSATLRVDAFPDRVLTGSVSRVAVLADSANMFMNPDLKVYPTAVSIEGVHDWLRPGMSAQVEILIETLDDVVYIPIQAVTYHGEDQVCYVLNGGSPERRVVEAGSFTEEFIEIKAGLEEGEEVLLLAPGVGNQDDVPDSDSGADSAAEGDTA